VTKQSSPKDTPFVTDIDSIRKRTRQHIEDAAVTDSYKGDRKVAIKVLATNQADEPQHNRKHQWDVNGPSCAQ
jgi:bacterioferritin